MIESSNNTDNLSHPTHATPNNPTDGITDAKIQNTKHYCIQKKNESNQKIVVFQLPTVFHNLYEFNREMYRFDTNQSANILINIPAIQEVRYGIAVNRAF